MPGASLAQKNQVEAAFLARLASELGGPNPACDAYRAWLEAKARPGLLEVSEVVKVVRWEAAHARAACHALADLAVDAQHAFFILHIGAENARGGRRAAAGAGAEPR